MQFLCQVIGFLIVFIQFCSLYNHSAKGHFEESEMGQRPPTRSDMNTYGKVRREQANQKAAVERYIRKRELEREKSRMKYMDDGGVDIASTPTSPELYQEVSERCRSP